VAEELLVGCAAVAVVEVVVTHTREEPPEDARPRRGGVCLVKLRVKVGARVRARAWVGARANPRQRPALA